MRRVNQNNLARAITKLEAGEMEVNIAQTKEILKCNWECLIDEYGYADIVHVEAIRDKGGSIKLNAV